MAALAALALASACASRATGRAADRPAAARVAGYSFPALTGRLVDAAHVLAPADRRAVDGSLAGLERRTGHQLFVVTVASLAGHTVEDYAFTLANRWGVGRRGLDDGVLVVVAPTERQMRIEVGCGLEAALTDAEAKAIIDRDMVPAFRAGDYARGVRLGVDDVVREIAPGAAA